MTAWKISLCLVGLVAVAGFSGASPSSACEHVATSYAQFNQKAQTCISQTDAVIPFNAVACQASTKDCNATDQALIEKFLGCVDRLPACSGAADETAWRAQYDQCAAGVLLSSGCSL